MRKAHGKTVRVSYREATAEERDQVKTVRVSYREATPEERDRRPGGIPPRRTVSVADQREEPLADRLAAQRDAIAAQLKRERGDRQDK